MRPKPIVAGMVLLVVAFTATPASSTCPPTLGYSALAGDLSVSSGSPSTLFQPVSLGGGGAYGEERFNVRAEATALMWQRMYLAVGLGLCDTAGSGTSLGLMPALAFGTMIALGTPGLGLFPQVAINRNVIDDAAYFTIPVTIFMAYALNPTLQLLGGPLAQVQRYSMSGYSSSSTQYGLTVGAQSTALGVLILHAMLTGIRNEVYESGGGRKNEISPTFTIGARYPL